MDFNALEENFKQLNAQMEAARKEMRSKSTGFVEVACKQFFDACPEVNAITWTQYTPYFNDGESCEFSVNETYFILVGDEDPDDYEGSVTYNEKDLARAEKDLAEAVAYTNDSVSWADKYKREYKERYGREYSSGYYASQPKPYPSDPAEAQEKIDEIKEFLAKYPDGAIERIETAFKSLTKALDLIDEDIMQSIYGDHVKITITRAGTEIDDYEHD